MSKITFSGPTSWLKVVDIALQIQLYTDQKISEFEHVIIAVWIYSGVTFDVSSVKPISIVLTVSKGTHNKTHSQICISEEHKIKPTKICKHSKAFFFCQ